MARRLGWPDHLSMSRIARLGIAMLAAVILATSTGSAALADDRPKTPQERADELAKQSADAKAIADELKSLVDAANAKIELLNAQRAAATAQVESLKAEIELAQQALVVAAAQLDATRADIVRLTAEIAEKQAQLESREALYARHMRETYRGAGVSLLEVLLSSTSLADFASRLDSMLFLDREDVRLVKEIRTLKADIESRRDAAAAKELELIALRQQITEQRAKLVEQKLAFEEIVQHATNAVAAQVVAKNDAQAGRDQALQAAARADAAAKALAAELARAENAYPELAAKLAAQSGLGLFTATRLAVRPVTDSVVSSPFGPRAGGFHNGIDLAAPMYTPVLAAGDGIVVTVGHPYLASGDTAEVVIIAHGSNFSTLYGHLDDLVKLPTVKLGQKVKVGDVIGYIGMSGHTTGPHLHFMTILNGTGLDPAIFLPSNPTK